MRIKAKTLLPRQEFYQHGNEADLQQNLIDALIEYKKFKNVSDQLKALEGIRLERFTRGNFNANLLQSASTAEPKDELSSLTLHKSTATYSRIIKRYELAQQNSDHLVIQYPYTIENQKRLLPIC